ncbi:polysaccharide biosynthesis/export family protein [Sphingobium limneticum]|uniref:polysaccharide biosynthesis/export family protein n=1 Tax=Sphingobium TaxID=165695 RepID=UPI003137A0A8
MIHSRLERLAAPSRGGRHLLVLALSLAMAACSGTGPSVKAIQRASMQEQGSAVYLVNLDMSVAQSTRHGSELIEFSASFGDVLPVGTRIGAGDVLSISLWEAPPAVLFGSSSTPARSVSDSVSALAQTPSGDTVRVASLPDQIVNIDGLITIPFAGQIQAIGRTTKDVEREIVRRLQRKAHMPQAIVSFARSATATATVVGEVQKSAVVPLTGKGERVLDVLAVAGGTKQPVNKTTIQLSRGTVVQSLPLEMIIRDPHQNVILMPGDVVTAYYQQLSFTSLGALGKNMEVPFEATGLSLAEALGRAGGLDGQNANPSGGFLFRFEDPRLLGLDPANPVRQTLKGPVRVALDAQGRVPVIYRFDLRDPATFFAAQNFPMRDKDIMYVSTASLVDITRFTNIISASVFPILSLNNLFNNNN